jgi:hypothetical protein
MVRNNLCVPACFALSFNGFDHVPILKVRSMHYFCQHTFTSVWGVVALSFKQRDRPNSYDQFDNWIRKALPGGDAVYMFDLAAICWVIWKVRNRACFKKKPIRNPNDVIFSACLFMYFWGGLFKGDMQGGEGWR